MSTPDLTNKHIVLAISAGIAAYKAPFIVRGLRAAGAEVQVVLSANAHHFVTPTTLQAVAGNPVRQDPWDSQAEAAMGHIELARWADVLIIAPATANTLAKLAHGVSDDLLTTLVLASPAPLWLAPAMNQQMWRNAATTANVALLEARGTRMIGPAEGDQACGDVGPGRMEEPEVIVGQLITELSGPRPLSGKRVLITAGPTREAIDPVRYISNHSSGKQGYAIAAAARDAGANVVLVSGPTSLEPPAGVDTIQIESAQEMLAAVEANLAGTNVFIGVAAVADYRPKVAAERKIKRESTGDLDVEMTMNPDIIRTVAEHEARPELVVGFAAETDQPLEHARAKRLRKKLDLIVVNDVSRSDIGFNSDENAATIIGEHGEVQLIKQGKDELARALLGTIADLMLGQLAPTNPESATQ